MENKIKMTDNDIIKALEHCASSKTSDACKGCPLLRDNGSCIDDGLLLYESALDVINHQKAEIKGLTEQNVRLNKECDHYIDFASTARAKAIEEFAEKVKKNAARVVGVDYWALVYAIDNLVKEMTEVHHESLGM